MFGISFGPKSSTVQEVHAALGKPGVLLLDVRSPEEVEEGAVPGARNIPLENVETQAASLKDYSTIYVMCRSGGRSSMAVSLLHKLGITEAVNVSGGILAWQAAGLPVTKG